MAEVHGLFANRPRGWLIAAAIAAIAGATWLAAIMVRAPLSLTDYRYIWLAGHVWAAGGNPYGAEYITESAIVFGDADKLSVWVYPFSWYFPARVLALLTPEQAFRAWQVLLALAAGVSGWCAYRAAFPRAPERNALLVLLLVAFCCTNTSVSGLLRSGQPALIAITGLALLLLAGRNGSRTLAVAGLVLASLKPQFGLMAFAAVATSRSGIVNALGAGIVILALSVPVIASDTFMAQLGALLRSLGSDYQAIPVNDPSRLIALPQLVYAATGWRLPIGPMVVVTAALVFVGCGYMRYRAARHQRDVEVGCIVVAILAIAFMIGVHGSDLAILLLLLPLSLRQPVGLPLALSAAGYLLLWRPENIARSLPDLFTAVGPGSIAASLICVSFLLRAHTLSVKPAVQRPGERSFDPAVEEVRRRDGDDGDEQRRH